MAKKKLKGPTVGEILDKKDNKLIDFLYFRYIMACAEQKIPTPPAGISAKDMINIMQTFVSFNDAGPLNNPDTIKWLNSNIEEYLVWKNEQ